MNDKIRQFLVIVFALSQWVSAGLVANAFYAINTTASEDYFIPSDGTFVVWAFIYTGTLIYAAYQALPAQRERTIHRRIGGWLGATYALSALWTVVSVQGGAYDSPDFQPLYILLTVVIIVGMLVTLTRAFVLFRQMDADLTRADRWLMQVPAALYFAWINVAVIANTTSMLVAFGWNGEPYGALWSAAMITVAIVLTSAMILYSRAGVGTLAYTAVILWAFIGIYSDNNAASALVGTLAVVGGIIAVLVTALHFFNSRKSQLPSQSVRAAA